MRSSYTLSYEFLKSIERLDEILDSTFNYEEKDDIPNRERLNYNNGFYVNCYAIFIDIRNSSELPSKYRRPTLAKIYKSYISELVAIFNSFESCKEINIVGDCVSGIFDVTQKSQVFDVLQSAWTSNSIVNILNYRLLKKGFERIKIGIGIAKGRALMIQAGFKGSGMKDVVWMGDVVNQASKLCSKGNKEVSSPIVISNEVYADLYGYQNRFAKDYQAMFTRSVNYYYGDIIEIDMEDWLDAEKNKH